MSNTLCGRNIDKVAVIGSGEIGPDIALHFTKELHDRDVPVVILDIEAQALDQGRNRVQEKIEQGVSRELYTDQEAEHMLNNLVWTQSADDVEGADLVIEAGPEEVDVKKVIFEGLEHRCPENAILASSSSHLPPEWIFDDLNHPERALILHYFFPAESNQLLEIVPGEHTNDSIIRWARQFYEWMGKAPITSGSRFGYAIDPIFEGIVQTSMHLVEEGVGTVREIDAIVRDVLDRDAGPFTLLNEIGGNVIVEIGMNGSHDEIMPWFQAPDLLEDKIREGTQWQVVGRGETVDYDEDTFERVKKDILGTYFGLVGEILESGISSVADLELGLDVGMNSRSPFEWMNELGNEKTYELVHAFAEKNEGFRVADPITAKKNSTSGWNVERVTREDQDGVAILHIRRWKKRNALNEEVFEQLRAHVEEIADDGDVDGVVLTGFGRKAFASGADISMLADLESPEQATAFSKEHHETLRLLETMDAPVIAALNGVALGGGAELALGCNGRVAKKNVPRLIGQPEPHLGLIPGLGGTQRLPRIIGLEEAWSLLRTGNSLSTEEAEQLGLLFDAVPGDELLQRATQLASEVAAGDRDLPSINEDPLEVPSNLPEVDIGHLSEKIDEYMQKAILEGAGQTLEDGLNTEAEYFGKCFETEDARIGLQNFLENGPSSKAIFVHR